MPPTVPCADFPTKPGYYWVRLYKLQDPDGESMTDGSRTSPNWKEWEICELMNGKAGSGWRLWRCGSDERADFEVLQFGPRVPEWSEHV